MVLAGTTAFVDHVLCSTMVCPQRSARDKGDNAHQQPTMLTRKDVRRVHRGSIASVLTLFAVCSVAACGSTSEVEPAVSGPDGIAATSTPTTSAETSQDPAATASPSIVPPLPAAFTLAENRIDVAGLGQQLSAPTGTITLSQADGGGELVVVRGTKKKGQVIWSLDIVVTGQSRAGSGTLTYAGRMWNVSSNTGDIRIARDAQNVSILSLNAITLTESAAPNANVPMVINLSGAVTP